MKRILAAAAALLAIATAQPAAAKSGTWAVTRSGWTITGDTEARMCTMRAYFDTSIITIGYAADDDVWALSFSGTDAFNGERDIRTRIRASNGTIWNLPGGVAINNGVVMYAGLTTGFVRSLAATRGIDVQNFGRFNMRGSAEAMRETIDCADAMLGNLS